MSLRWMRAEGVQDQCVSTDLAFLLIAQVGISQVAQDRAFVTVRAVPSRSALGGHAGHGYCAWCFTVVPGLRRYLVRAGGGMPMMRRLASWEAGAPPNGPTLRRSGRSGRCMSSMVPQRPDGWANTEPRPARSEQFMKLVDWATRSVAVLLHRARCLPGSGVEPGLSWAVFGRPS